MSFEKWFTLSLQVYGPMSHVRWVKVLKKLIISLYLFVTNICVFGKLNDPLISISLRSCCNIAKVPSDLLCSKIYNVFHWIQDTINCYLHYYFV